MKQAGNTKGKFEFVLSHIWWCAIAWIWYKLLFICIWGCSLKASRWILLGTVVLISGGLLALGMKDQRNSFRVFIDVVTGYGTYAVLTLFPVRRKLMLSVLITAAVLALIYAVLVVCYKVEDREQRLRILGRRLRKAGRGGLKLMCLGLALIMLVIGVGVVWGTGLLKPSVKPADRVNLKEQTIANNIDTLALLYDDNWNTLPVKEKLDVLQLVANIEQRWLGLPNELNVYASNLDTLGLLGSYQDSEHKIMVDVNSLLNDSAAELVNTVAHEAFHCYQHRVVDAYDAAADDQKQLMLFYDAAVYKKEFAAYEEADEDNIEAYYYQQCEIDARQYARDAVNEYFQRVYEYLGIETEAQQ